MFVVLFKYR